MGFITGIFGMLVGNKMFSGVMLIALIGAAGYVSVLKWNAHSLEASNAKLAAAVAQRDTAINTLNMQKETLEQSVTSLQKEVKLVQDTQTTLEGVIETLNTNAAKETAAVKAVDDAPATDDGCVAPVLRRAIDGLPD